MAEFLKLINLFLQTLQNNNNSTTFTIYIICLYSYTRTDRDNHFVCLINYIFSDCIVDAWNK